MRSTDDVEKGTTLWRFAYYLYRGTQTNADKSDSYIHVRSNIGYTARDWIASVDCDTGLQGYHHGGDNFSCDQDLSEAKSALFRLAATV